MDSRPAKRMIVTIVADAFDRLAVRAARERRRVRDQAAVELERLLLPQGASSSVEQAQQDRAPVEAGAT